MPCNPCDRLGEIIRQFQGWPPEPNAPRFGSDDSLALALTDMGAFRLGHIREDAQDQVADECRRESLANRRVENRHVENANMNVARLDQFTPHRGHFLVVTSETIKACDD